MLWLLGLLLSESAASAEIQKFLSSREVLTTPIEEKLCHPGSLFALIAEGETEAHAVGEAQRFEDNRCALLVQAHSDSLLVRPGDRVEPLDLLKNDERLRGRFDLLREGKRKFSSRYKPLIYGGYLFGQTASTLDNNEWLVGLAPLAFGITDHVQLDTVPLLALAKIAQMGVKARVQLNEDMRIAPYFRIYRYFDVGQSAWEAALYLDSTSNARSMTHTRLTYKSKLPDSLPLADKSKENKASIELSTVNEWILPSWHRILFGPKFITGEKSDLGATLSFIWVFNSFHAAANLEINTVRKLDFRSNKQTFSGDLFWRF